MRYFEKYSPLLDLEWPVSKAGYEIVESDQRWNGHNWVAVPGRYVALRFDPELPLLQSLEPKQPLKHTGLFLEMAALHPASEEKILKFANEFGWLFASQSEDRLVIQRPGLPSIDEHPLQGLYVQGEPVSRWQAEVRELHDCVKLYRAANSGDYAAFQDSFRWLGAIATFRGKIIAAPNHRPERLLRVQEGDVLTAAAYRLKDAINEKLAANPVRAFLSDGPQLTFTPNALCSAVWLQLAQAVEGNKEYSSCKTCRRPFEVGAEVRRGASYCSNACRQTDYRQRQHRARELHRQGVSVAEIARRLDSQTNTIRGWVKK